MDIKEIALKVARNMAWALEVPSLRVKAETIEHFAEALVTELAKQNEPVAYATTSEDGDMAMLFFDDGEARKYSGDDAPIKLYTFPPTAEQIANETAEACAKYVNCFLNGDGIQDEAWIRDIESGIRRGTWKEFKK